MEQVDEEGRRAALSVARLVCTLSGVRWGLPSWLMDTARERARRWGAACLNVNEQWSAGLLFVQRWEKGTC